MSLDTYESRPKFKIGILGDGQLGHRMLETFKQKGFTARCYGRKNGFDATDFNTLDDIVNSNVRKYFFRGSYHVNRRHV